jgi:hypothetical protein
MGLHALVFPGHFRFSAQPLVLSALVTMLLFGRSGALQDLTRPLLARLPAHPVLQAPFPLQMSLCRANNALVATFVLLVPLHGLVSAAVEATTAPVGLVFQPPAPTKYLHLVDGALCKCKALHSL